MARFKNKIKTSNRTGMQSSRWGWSHSPAGLWVWSQWRQPEQSLPHRAEGLEPVLPLEPRAPPEWEADQKNSGRLPCRAEVQSMGCSFSPLSPRLQMNQVPCSGPSSAALVSPQGGASEGHGHTCPWMWVAGIDHQKNTRQGETKMTEKTKQSKTRQKSNFLLKIHLQTKSQICEKMWCLEINQQ